MGPYDRNPAGAQAPEARGMKFSTSLLKCAFHGVDVG